jgi:hypothetical protein
MVAISTHWKASSQGSFEAACPGKPALAHIGHDHWLTDLDPRMSGVEWMVVETAGAAVLYCTRLCDMRILAFYCPRPRKSRIAEDHPAGRRWYEGR